jgi:hypothetical protein
MRPAAPSNRRFVPSQPAPRSESATPVPARPAVARLARTPRTRPAQAPVAGQLELGIAPELPVLAIAPEWKDQQRLWGHSFHPMCSYLASFPAALTHAFIARYSRPGDVVLDPFSGRGTTPLQACAEGRVGAGNDLNPLAHLLTAAKVDPPATAETATRLLALRLAWSREAPAWDALAGGVIAGPDAARVPGAGSRGGPAAGTDIVPAEVALAFHRRTLGQLLFVRAALDQQNRTDRFLLAALTGILHGKSPSYLSEIMPNTFSMAPRYVRDYAARTDFQSPERDVFVCLGLKLKRLGRQPVPPTRGIALLGDARDAGRRFGDALRQRSLPAHARLVVTSPPYLRVVKYGYYNWLRTWLIGADAREIDATLDDAHHRVPYLTFLRETLADLRTVLTDDAVVVLVIGDIERDRGRHVTAHNELAEAAWAEAAEPEGYRLAGVALDDIAAHRKMTKLWGDEAGHATKTDRILVLGATEAGRRRAISGASLPVDWTWPRRLRAL